jgi:hypothetical protein
MVSSAGHTGRMRRRRGPLPRACVPALGAVLALVTVACSGDDDPGAAQASTTVVTAPSSDVANPPEVAASTSVSDTASTDTASTETPTTETIATVPEQGVPGLDSTDAFCRGWSEFAGSFQALAFASAVGSDPAAAARLEVVASGAVSAASQLMAEEFPEAIVFERDLFVDEVIGPFARRASRASAELLAAGLSPDQIDRLGEVWLMALADTGVDEPDVVVTVPDEFVGAVDAATVVFVSERPPIVADPSLVTDAVAPATLDHLAENCPDQGILGGNDAID